MRREMWEHQNEPFVRDFLQFSHFVASKLTCCHCGCRAVAGQIGGRRDYANTSRNVAASDATRADATMRRREHKSQRRSVRRDYAKTPPKLATSQRQRQTRTQVATSQRQTRLREDAAQTRNVAASDAIEADATTRRREHKSQRRSVRRDKGRRDYANTSRNVAASNAIR